MYEGPTFGSCGSYPCLIDGAIYKLDFDGDIKQDNLPKSKWTPEMLEHFNINRDAIYQSCTYPTNCKIDDKVVVPFEVNPDTDKIV